MGQKFQYCCPVETWRLLWLMGMMFAMIVIFQYFELPYGNFLLSISSVRNALVGGNSSLLTDAASPKPEKFSNMTQLNDLNSTGSSYGSHESANNYGKENAADVNNDHVSEGTVGWNKSSGIDNHEKDSSKLNPVNSYGNGSVPDETKQSFSQKNITFTSEHTGTSDSGLVPIVPALPPLNSSPNMTFPRNVESEITTPGAPVGPNITALDKDATPRNAESIIVTPIAPLDPNTSVLANDATPSLANNGKSGELQNNLPPMHDNSSVTATHKAKNMPEKPISSVIPISEMNNLLLKSWSFPNVMKPRWSSAVDQELLNAKSLIGNAPIVKNDPMLYASLYRNVSMFKRSYELMEQKLKVYIYREGEKPILHQPILKGIYASEGWFMKLLEANRNFITKNPRKAHLFYLPFSSRNLEVKLYVPNSHSHKNLIEYLKKYLDIITTKYPYWNRTEGADHFLVACHDWAPSETKHLMTNCIRALCNSDIVKEGFVLGKDVSLPETNVLRPQNPLRDLGGKPPSQRSILAFFAGSMHGYLRSILLQHWGNKDPDMKIFGRMPRVRGKMGYIQHMKSSKYCICAKGYEVNSPRVVEAIFYECVPVIISDNFVPPFFEVLNWESFAVFVLEKDIPNLKNILLAIPEKRYLTLQMRVKMVQKHFLWHPRPVKYDLFHMILHSVWYNRVFQM